MSLTFRAITSLTRSPAPYATDNAVRCLRFRAESIRRPTSSRLKITGSVCATRTGRILAIKSARLMVTSKKNLSPVIVALSVIGETPRSTQCS
jgi:hypothetical protein